MPRYKCHVIANTHWDREWRYPFQSYRMDLVEMMDGLLGVLDEREGYRAFLLDSQTTILEDYLEMRPENADRIRKHAQANRLQIGPWYTLPDQWGCPGEALVRNLLVGHQVGKQFGPIFKVGYTPFSNGQVSQLPQLYNGFGIDSCFFYRGIGKHIARQEFLWDSPDGSRVYGFKFGDYARYNYYYLAYRPGLLNRFAKDRDYTWTPEEVPYHMAVEQAQDRQYGWIAQELKVHRENLPKALEDTRKFTFEDATTRHLLYMMGHDHSFATEKEVDLVEALQEAAGPDGDEIVFSSLDDYLESFRGEAKDLQIFSGEMRHTNKIGLWTTLMGHILSCRLYLKQRNAAINSKVLYGSEPLAMAAWLGGTRYPKPFLDQAWRIILWNQAHDAIGGCSVDRVHEEMLTRWNSVETISDEIVRRSLRDIAARIDGSKIGRGDIQLTIFNPLPIPRREVAEFVIDLPHAQPDTPFAVETTDGRPVATQVLERWQYDPTIEGPYELTMPFEVERVRMALDLEDVPAFGHDVLVVKPGAEPSAPAESIVKSDTELENEFLRVKVNTNGTATLTDKRSGIVREQIFYFEDTAEFGDPWNRVQPEGDTPILSLDCKARLAKVADGPLAGAIAAEFGFSIPKGKDGKQRAQETIALPVRVVYTLRKGQQALDVRIEMENKAENHRLRLMIPSDIGRAMTSHADGQYDVLERTIPLPDATGFKEPPYKTHPMWNFVDVSDGREGFAVINDGLIEYEAADDERRTIGITLLRAFGTFIYGRPTPGSQCLRPLTFHFWLYPHAGNWEEGGLTEWKSRFTAPLQALFSAPTRGSAPTRQSLFELQGGLHFGAIKLAEEDADTMILRIVNPHAETRSATIRSLYAIAKAQILTMEELPQSDLPSEDGNTIALDIPAKKIVTVGLQIRK